MASDPEDLISKFATGKPLVENQCKIARELLQNYI